MDVSRSSSDEVGNMEDNADLLCDETMPNCAEEPMEANAQDIDDLLCDETMPDFSKEPTKAYAPTTTEEDDEYVRTLFGKETANDAAQLINGPSRTDAVNYILGATEARNFKFETAYLAVIYLDRALSRKQDGHQRQSKLLAMACLSLAVKMEEIEVLPLSQIPLVEQYRFESEEIKKMEFEVLKLMGWRMEPVTPFAFVDYFESRFFGGLVPAGLRSRTSQMIMDGVKDVNLMRHKPSAIAAAAISLALERPRLTKQALELRLNGSSCNKFLNIEDIWGCCILLHEIEREVSTPPSALDLNAQTSSRKRKRRGSNDSDEDGDNPPEDEN